MTKRIVLIISLALASASLLFAQAGKTVTNADLEKFRQKRLTAEKDYRENYEKWGFPSPEELARRNAQHQVEFGELSARLSREKLEKDAAKAWREQLESAQYLQYPSSNYQASESNYSFGYAPYGFYNSGGYQPYYGYRAPQPYGYLAFGYSNSSYRARPFPNRRNWSSFAPARTTNAPRLNFGAKPNFPKRGGRRF